MDPEVLRRFHNDLVGFDSSYPIVVTYQDNQLRYRQLHRIVAVPYMNNYFFPKKVKMGLLLPSDFKVLLEDITRYLQDPDVNNGAINTGIKELSFVLYKTITGMVGPQIVYEFNLISITRSWLSRLLLKRYNTDSRLLLKQIKDEYRTSKRNKSLPITESSSV